MIPFAYFCRAMIYKKMRIRPSNKYLNSNTLFNKSPNIFLSVLLTFFLTFLSWLEIQFGLPSRLLMLFLRSAGFSL